MADQSMNIKVKDTSSSRDNFLSSVQLVEFVAVEVKIENELESREEGVTNDTDVDLSLQSAAKEEKQNYKASVLAENSTMADKSLNIKAEDTISSTEHLSNSNLTESEAIEVRVKNEPLSDEDQESENFHKITPLFISVNDLTKEIKVENTDALSDGMPFSADIMSFRTDSNCLLTKEEDLDMFVEEGEEGATQVGFNSRVSFDNEEVSNGAEEDFRKAIVSQGAGDFAPSFQVSAVRFSTESAAEYDGKDSLQDSLLASTSETVFSCTYCSARFRTEQLLKQHVNIHSSEKPFSCLLCPAKFATKGHLNQHSTVHSSEKPFSCPHCLSKFKRRARLESHVIIHLSGKLFSCALCPAKFATKGHLAGHSTVHSNEQPFSCPHCSSKFKRRKDLNKHLLSHTNERRFGCSHCAAKFKTKYHLMKHLQVHSKKGPFSCSYCTSTFKNKQSLTLHIVDSHPLFK